EDIASVAARSVPISRANDEPVRIPANGFILAGTLSKPTTSPAPKGGRLPAVVLLGGSGPADRDTPVAALPVLRQIPKPLADAGLIVVRYDKRGIGQSGGRTETAGLNEYAEDARAAVRDLTARKDVDAKHIAAIGHSEGRTVTLNAAPKDKGIHPIGLLATPGTTGDEVVLAQQRRILNKSTMSAEEKQEKIDQQKRIHAAVISGKGWEQIPISIRRSVDNPEFQTILTTDP